MTPKIFCDSFSGLLNKPFLVLGKQLGAGAFGVVTKGWATGIFSHQKETTVAVKMLKKTAENEVS